MTDQRWALLWHILEFALIISTIGVVWAIEHRQPVAEARPR